MVFYTFIPIQNSIYSFLFWITIFTVHKNKIRMSQMLTEIMRIVSEDVSSRVTQYDVLFEAITNSIQANATKITCTLQCVNPPLEGEDGLSLDKKKVNNITITDNGNGFNDSNYDSFIHYRTKYKKDLGCKGVGRLTFLKVYRNVRYNSKLKDEKEVRSFVFNEIFDTDNLNKEKNEEITENLTEVQFIEVTPEYFNTERDLDRRIYLDLPEIKEKILLHLIPTLFFYQKRGVNIEIQIIDSTSGELEIIVPSDVPSFQQKPFVVSDKDSVKYNFNLNYKVDNTGGKLNAYYCANNRTVCEFSEKELKLSLPSGYSGFFLLESPYFDSHVNNERNDFDIFKVRTDVFSTLSWEMINEKLKDIISKIVRVGIPDAENINVAKLKTIEKERPYLVEYIQEEDIQMAGFLDKKHIIEKAKKRFDTAKEKVLINAGKESYTDSELQEAIQLTQNELVSYINDRVQVLERLRKLVDNKEQVENIIHNLFMERRTEDDYFSVGKNNLWLLDDRFTSYSYAASEKHIHEVLDAVGETSDEIENKNDRPDLSIFFSHNPNNPKRLKSVLVEIKPFDFKSKSDRKKFAGIQQLRDYVKAFKTKENIEEIFAFLITDVDDKLAARLIDDGYTPLFSTEAPIYHRFLDKAGISIYVVGAKTLIIDAEARNKVFLDIIRKQSRLHKMLVETPKKIKSKGKK